MLQYEHHEFKENCWIHFQENLKKVGNLFQQSESSSREISNAGKPHSLYKVSSYCKLCILQEPQNRQLKNRSGAIMGEFYSSLLSA